MTTQKKDIKCPHCDKPGTWSADNPYRPFCSERCKLIDLGDWADNKHRIPGEAADPNELPPDQDGDSSEENDGS